MEKQVNIFQLYTLLEKKLTKSFPKEKYEKVINKLDRMIGLIYGSIIGLMCGAATQPLGLKSAQSFAHNTPFCALKYGAACSDPVMGQLLAHLNEFKISKWDSTKYKSLTNYKSVMCNSAYMKVDLHPQLIEQIRTGKSSDLYNLYSEDFYMRVPYCALFGDATIDTVIGKIQQTHTSFEASAYGLLTVSVIQLALLNNNVNDWNQIIKEKLIPLLGEYYNISSQSDDSKSTSEADKLRTTALSTRMNTAYNNILEILNNALLIYTSDNKNQINENVDHMTIEEKSDYKITKIYSHQLDGLNLETKHCSHPFMLAVWVAKTINEVIKLYGDNFEPTDVSRLILRSVAIKTGMSAYNCMIVGSVLGSIFGFTQIPEEFYESMDSKLMSKINLDIIEIISTM